MRVFGGCGFCRSNGTPLAPSPRSSPWRRIHLSDGVRGLWPGVSSGVSQVQLVLYCVWLGGHPTSRGRALRRGGAAATPLDGVGEPCPWRRGRASRAASTQLGPFTSHPPSAAEAGAATASGAGRRLLPTASASAPPRGRRLLPTCGFSHRGRG